MRRLIPLLFIIHISVAAIGQDISTDSLQSDLQKTLAYIINHQNRETKENVFAGEWHSTMGLHIRFPLLGKPKDYEDANCFTTAAVHNALAKIYLLNTSSYNYLIPSINKAYSALLLYRDSTTFNFWHKLPTNIGYKNKDGVVPLVHRPTTYKLRTRYMRKAANVADDADDTSEGYMALLLHNLINNSKDTLALLPSISRYCDEERKNNNWYNVTHHDHRNTGAYLTWLGKEHKLWPNSIVNTFIQNLIFYLPFSECFPHAYVPYIPYGANDVDAVVNANVLTFLAENNELAKAKNADKAVDYIYGKIKRGKFNTIAIYYPNRYHLHYAVAKAYASGVTGLQPAVKLLIADIKKTQKADGSFISKKGVNHHDKIQSTAYALYCMLKAGNYTKYETRTNIELALKFIFKNRIESTGECYWNGGVFFSGGTVIKRVLYFKSEAVTSALIAQNIAIYLNLVEKKEL